uniref:Uncharacterized protein n=1 Tax=Chromera velia CCMP2878 TaxID=1169474 RepID=A0A0G4HHI7_9ALVE|eukprot:Cvel_6882.t1-p1 / transcript=Cvel_6882.t1 / gene=Cvel_6882 / organism=Chromera_velia_CCMP2878 / gene_product=Ankyrin repeat domain-containing protein 50, putative / transcript_product=Ankyrin repeat domain-containing protein 50, putative / location=Cvel_scaffold348:21234-27695(+) / protein_length=701 / sequence_SO=supercontig / SO=protein_coding / is_pseudo=false
MSRADLVPIQPSLSVETSSLSESHHSSEMVSAVSAMSPRSEASEASSPLLQGRTEADKTERMFGDGSSSSVPLEHNCPARHSIGPRERENPPSPAVSISAARRQHTGTANSRQRDGSLLSQVDDVEPESTDGRLLLDSTPLPSSRPPSADGNAPHLPPEYQLSVKALLVQVEERTQERDKHLASLVKEKEGLEGATAGGERELASMTEERDRLRAEKEEIGQRLESMTFEKESAKTATPEREQELASLTVAMERLEAQNTKMKEERVKDDKVFAVAREMMDLLLPPAQAIATRKKKGVDSDLLRNAIEKNDLEKVKCLLRLGATSQMAVFQAALLGRVEILQAFFEEAERKGETINLDVTDSGMTPLFYATWNRHLEAVKFLHGKGAKIDAPISKTPLLVAACLGHISALRLLLQRGAEIPPVGTVMIINRLIGDSIDKDDLEEVKRLFSIGLQKVKAGSPIRIYPSVVCKAASKNRLETLRFFADEGAKMRAQIDVDRPDRFGDTVSNHEPPIVRHGHTFAVEQMMWSTRSTFPWCGPCGPVCCAAVEGHLEAVKLLVKMGTAVDPTVAGERMPLFWAAGRGHLEIVKFLVQEGARRNVKIQIREDVLNLEGWTPLLAAASNGHTEVVAFLCGKGADIDVVDTNGETPVHAAAKNGHRGTVKVLVQLGAKLDTKNKWGQSAAEFLFQSGDAAPVLEKKKQ